MPNITQFNLAEHQCQKSIIEAIYLNYLAGTSIRNGGESDIM